MDQQVKKLIPSIKGFPLIGNLMDFRYNRLSLLQRVSEECGDIGKFRVGPTDVILLNAPKYIRKALIEHAYSFRKPGAMTSLVRPVIGNGLFIAEGEEHIQQRKQMTPIFQHRNIIKYDNIITGYVDQVQRTWRSGGIIDITSEVMRLTLEIIGYVLFSEDISREAGTIRKKLGDIEEHINNKISSLLPISIAYPTKQNYKFKEAIRYIDSVIQKAIDERHMRNNDSISMLSMLLQTEMTGKQIRDEMMNLFIAGHETTALAVIWSLYLLAKHPEIYQEMQNEIDTVLCGRKPIHKDLSKLPLTLQVLKESLRLYPPAYLLARKALCDIDLEDQRIPKGKVIAVSPYTIHRRSKYFADPNTFNPSRFETEDQNQAYIPFGLGPHACLGSHFAMIEAQIILVTMIQTANFELVQGQNIVPQPLTTLYPNQPIKMIVKHRSGAQGQTIDVAEGANT